MGTGASEFRGDLERGFEAASEVMGCPAKGVDTEFGGTGGPPFARPRWA